MQYVVSGFVWFVSHFDVTPKSFGVIVVLLMCEGNVVGFVVVLLHNLWTKPHTGLPVSAVEVGTMTAYRALDAVQVYGAVPPVAWSVAP